MSAGALLDPSTIHYHSRKDGDPCDCQPRKGYRHYAIDALGIVPSVSTIAGVIDKSGPLMAYAARCTREGVVAMIAQGESIPDDQRLLDRKLRGLGLHHDQRTGDSQDRGVAIHAMAEDWINEGRVPSPRKVRPAWRGWAKALALFLVECEPEFEASEVTVGSAVHGFAGRFDAIARSTEKGKLDRPGRGLIDFKTSKGIYPTSQFVQLEGYGVGCEECGFGAMDWRAIVRLGDDGSYEVGYSTATADDFLSYLDTYRRVQRLEPDRKKGGKK